MTATASTGLTFCKAIKSFQVAVLIFFGSASLSSHTSTRPSLAPSSEVQFSTFLYLSLILDIFFFVSSLLVILIRDLRALMFSGSKLEILAKS